MENQNNSFICLTDQESREKFLNSELKHIVGRILGWLKIAYDKT